MSDYSVTTPNGTFEGDTMKEAQRLARAAARASKTAEKLLKANSEKAQMLANSNGYRLYSLALRPAGPPRGIRFCSREKDYVSKRISQHYYPIGEEFQYSPETGDGIAYRHNGYTIHGIVENGGGFELAVVLRGCSDTEEWEFLAVGVVGISVAFANLPGLDWKVFDRPKTPVEG